MTPIIIVVVYLALTIGLGVWLAKYNKTVQTYFVAKRELGVLLIIPLLFANVLGGGGVVGNASMSFNVGLSGAWTMIGLGLGTIIAMPTVGKFYRVMGAKKNTMTVAEVFQYRFDERSRIIVLFLVTVTFIIILSATATSAAAIIAPMLGVSNTVIIWTFCFIMMLVTLTGGLKGIAWMNTLHTLVMYVCTFLVLFAAIHYVGGVHAVVANVPTSYFRLDQPRPAVALAWALGSIFTSLTSSMVVSVIYGAKNDKAASRGIAIGALLVIPFALALAVIGICAKIAVPDSTANSALYNIANACGGAYGGMISMTVLAAILSSNIPTMLVVSTTLTKDFYVGFIKKDASERAQLGFSRMMIVVLYLLTTYIGMRAKSILMLMTGAFQIVSVTGVVLLIGIYWKRMSSAAAFWSMLIGGSGALIWFILGNPFGVEPAWPGIGCTLLLSILISLFSKDRTAPGYVCWKKLEKEYDLELSGEE